MTNRTLPGEETRPFRLSRDNHVSRPSSRRDGEYGYLLHDALGALRGLRVHEEAVLRGGRRRDLGGARRSGVRWGRGAGGAAGGAEARPGGRGLGRGGRRAGRAVGAAASGAASGRRRCCRRHCRHGRGQHHRAAAAQRRRRWGRHRRRGAGRVTLDVLREVVAAHEATFADRADEALLAGVRAAVARQLVRAREPLHARVEVAHERLLSCNNTISFHYRSAARSRGAPKICGVLSRSTRSERTHLPSARMSIACIKSPRTKVKKFWLSPTPGGLLSSLSPSL